MRKVNSLPQQAGARAHSGKGSSMADQPGQEAFPGQQARPPLRASPSPEASAWFHAKGRTSANPDSPLPTPRVEGGPPLP